jgi:uncharacterized membrane protein
LWRLMSHRHWITLKILGKEIRLCARCLGFVVGYSIVRNIQPPPTFYTSENITQLVLCALFAIPLIFDWGSQSWGLRDSNNSLRFITGIIAGQGISLLSFSTTPLQAKIVFYLNLAIIVMIFGLLGICGKAMCKKQRFYS